MSVPPPAPPTEPPVDPRSGAPIEPIVPDWPAPANVRALVTTRAGGVSPGPYASLNLGAHCGDDPAAVAENRARLVAQCGLPQAPRWLRQVHGTAVVDLAQCGAEPEADAAFATRRGRVCAVLTADCLPVLLCDDGGSVVAAAHAGWRGLAAGVLERTIAALPVAPARLMAWLGPAIGPASFEVGPEVREAFVGDDAGAAEAFVAGAGDRWRADLYRLARRRLARAGVARVFGGGACTLRDPQRFFSFRRDRDCGRMASLAWLE